MFKLTSWHRLFFVSLLVLLGAGWVIAQTSTPTTITTCDTAELIFNQYEMQRQLDLFDELYLEDPQTALALLYEAGKTYQQMALACGYLPPEFASLAIGTDLTIIMNALENLIGDPIRGQLLYNDIEPSGTGNQLACAGCHESGGAVAPPTEGTWTRWDEVHRLEAQFADYTFAKYIAESIVLPDAYVVSDFMPHIMPNHYGERATYQDLADLIAYLESQDQLLDD